MPSHIVLAYSGGLDTSVAVHWLKQKHDADVTCVLIDLGQPIKGLEAAVARAHHNGAKDVIVIDAKKEFCDQHIAPAIQANAMYEGRYPLATALGRPLIAKKLVEVALKVGADAIAHGCTGKGNDQVRIEAGIKALAPHILCLAPQRTHPMSRPEVLRYAEKHGLELPPIKNSPYSVDENLYGRSCEGHDVEDPANAVPEAAYSWTASPFTAPDAPGTFTIGFEAGIPVSLDGQAMDLESLVHELNTLAGNHGVGRIDMVENRLVGIKTREVYEAPAAIAILTAKQALESLVLTRDEAHAKPSIEQQYAQLVYDGKWFSPVKAAMDAYVQTMQSVVTGTVTVQAYKGTMTVLGTKSPNALFDAALATYDDGDTFHHQDASGFIAIYTLPQMVAAKARGTTMKLQADPVEKVA